MQNLLLTVRDGAAFALQSQRLQVSAAIQTDLVGSPAVLANERGDLLGERARCLGVPARHRRPHDLRMTRLLHRFEAGRHVRALRVLEQDDRALGRHEEIAGRVAQEIPEHVSRARRVALIEGIE